MTWREWCRQLVLPTVVAGTAFVALALWHGHNLWPAAPQAIAQTIDEAPPEAIPSGLEAAGDEVPDQPTDHVPAEARRRHVGANAVWMSEANVPPAVAHEPPIDTLPLGAASSDKDTAARVQSLLAQHEQVEQALPHDPPPATLLEHAAGPPRMDSGDPNPDRLQNGQDPGANDSSSVR
jgi:hypothetical protein